MILREALDGFLLLALLGAGLGFSAVLLANRGGVAPTPAPLPRLNGYLFLIAAGIFLGLVAAISLLFAEQGETLLVELAGGVAAGVATWVFLRLTSGATRQEGSALGYAWTAGSYFCALPGLLALMKFNEWLVVVVHQIGDLFREQATPPPAPVQEVVAGLQQVEARWDYAGVVVAVILFAPVVEEALFRGYLWRFLAGRADFGPRRGLLFSTLVFMLVHPPVVWLPIAYLGLFFGWVCWRTGSVRQAMFAHVLHNGLGAGAAMLLA